MSGWRVSTRIGGARLALVSLLLLVGLGACGHGGDSTGPSTTSTNGVNPASFNFGSNNPRVASAFGDSITFGVLELKLRSLGLTTSNNYPANLQRLLQGLDPAWVVLNRGVPGETTAGGLSRIGSVLRGDRPGVLLLMEGTNDSSACDSSDSIVANLQSMVQQAKANRTLVIIGTIPPNFRTPYCAQDVIDNANTKIHGMAAAEGIPVAEIFDGMNNRSLFGVAPDRDPLHPNDQGYQVMANIWFAAMKANVPNIGLATAQTTRGGGTVAAAQTPQASRKR